MSYKVISEVANKTKGYKLLNIVLSIAPLVTPATGSGTSDLVTSHSGRVTSDW